MKPDKKLNERKQKQQQQQHKKKILAMKKKPNKRRYIRLIKNIVTRQPTDSRRQMIVTKYALINALRNAKKVKRRRTAAKRKYVVHILKRNRKKPEIGKKRFTIVRGLASFVKDVILKTKIKIKAKEIRSKMKEYSVTISKIAIEGSYMLCLYYMTELEKQRKAGKMEPFKDPEDICRDAFRCLKSNAYEKVRAHRTTKQYFDLRNKYNLPLYNGYKMSNAVDAAADKLTTNWFCIQTNMYVCKNKKVLQIGPPQNAVLRDLGFPFQQK